MRWAIAIVLLAVACHSPAQQPERIVHEPSGVALAVVPDEPDPFYLGETEVTVAQFRRFVDATGYVTDAERGADDGGHGIGAFATVPAGDRDWSAVASWRNPFPNIPDYRLEDDHPVVQVSWNDARAFADHYGLALPTEAQWEQAYRAGSTTPYPWGDSPEGGIGQGNVTDTSGRTRFRARNVYVSFDDGVAMIAPVGRYRPNALGLYDLMGNVQEWCAGSWSRDPNDDTHRVIRGSSWLSSPEESRSDSPRSRRDFIGFRVAGSLRGLAS